MSAWPGILGQYGAHLDLPKGVPSITLLEGNTPVIPVPAFATELGASEFYVKFEGLNPTGSFKDRGMTAAISEAAYRNIATVVCASTGNTAASAAAYSARAGIRCIVLLPAGKVAPGKLAAAYAHGAEVVQIVGDFDQALDLATQLAEIRSIGLVNSLNPFRLEGQKSAAFELCDQLGAAPDWLALPVGNAGNITSYWMGFRHFASVKGTGLPRLLGVQAAGAAPLVLGHPVSDPETQATAIRVGRPARGEQALEAAAESRGRIVAVADALILTAQQDLAQHGLWVEPASAAGLAGLRAEVRAGRLELADQRVVCICTGHGLKDPTIPSAEAPIVRPEFDALVKLLNL